MKKEDKIELAISIICTLIAIVSLIIIPWAKENNIIPLAAGLFAFSVTGAFFFFMSFNARKYRS